jgi:hypothetical protein
MKAARTAVAAARTVRDLACLPTQPLMCQKCTTPSMWITPRQRISRLIRGRARCFCGGDLRPIQDVRLP